ncbi:hypothetical protein U1701_11045 [Sphingomonas sp. PB2P19]
MDDDDTEAPAEREEAEYAFEGYRIAFNRRVALTPPAAAAPALG